MSSLKGELKKEGDKVHIGLNMRINSRIALPTYPQVITKIMPGVSIIAFNLNLNLGDLVTDHFG